MTTQWVSVTGRWFWNRSLWLASGRRRWIVPVGVVLVGLAQAEMHTSWLQSKLFAAAARRVAYSVRGGASASMRLPASGPYDDRLGYSGQARFIGLLQNDGFDILSQARWSPFSTALVDAGFFAVYATKHQAGLRITGDNSRILYSARYPRRIYYRFDAIPPVLVESLLFIENRELLQGSSTRNPAIEYDRLARALLDVGMRAVKPRHPVSGGSTLATQLEKLRHSSGGRTESVLDKGRQIVSASLRAYLPGENTIESRQEIARAYLNALPLGAIAGHGEVIGLGDGLWAWFDADFAAVNRLLGSATGAAGDAPPMAEQALAYRQALTLLLAVKKPTTYLSHNRAALETRTDGYLRVLAGAKVIPAALRDAALGLRPKIRDRVSAPAPSFGDRKSIDGVRVELLSRLGLGSAYDLDRLDLTVHTTLNGAVNDAVSQVLHQIGDRRAAGAAGLMTKGLLSRGQPKQVIYSFTLYERRPEGNLLRVQSDTYDQPLNINDGTRLELGSTAKLRTLVTYLDCVEALHRRYADVPATALRAMTPHPADRLTRWAIDYLVGGADRNRAAMLEAAMNRRYSANPAESFFTGGGVHRFRNFDARDSRRVITVREGFQRSVNLVFIRIMRDLVRYHTYRSPETTAVLDDPKSPMRRAYLSRFADTEGRDYLRRFYRTRSGTSTAGTLERLSRAGPRTATRLAVLLRFVRPEATVDELAGFLNAHGATQRFSVSRVEALYTRYDPSAWSLEDLGYLARLHPLDLWLVRYLHQHPTATISEVIAASADQRQEAYGWLFRTANQRVQQRAIQTLVEAEAFGRIHTVWAHHGYPFRVLVPSYATAIGSSGDNPAALSELLGIVLNGGVRQRSIRIEQLRFADGTPYETDLARRPLTGERVLSTDAAALLRRELIGVVEHGTGRRVAGGVELPDGRRLAIGGKTGTGENRLETAGPAGRTSRVVNRTAAFTFTVGDRLFGTILAFVPSREAEAYDFTSALPVQVFKNLLPVLVPVFEDWNEHRARTASRR